MILDTNAVSALFTGDASIEKTVMESKRQHLPVVVIGEYRYGLLRSRHRRLLGRLLETLIEESVVLHVDEETAASYSDVKDELRRRGRPIPANDLWIAALARQHDLPILSRDGHFDEVVGLKRLGW